MSVILPIQKNDNNLNNNELNEIFNKILNDKQNNLSGVKLLCIFINKNRNNTDEIIKRISLFFNAHDNLSDFIILKTIEEVLPLLTENSQMINFLNMMLPILVNLIYFSDKKIEELDKILNTIGSLILKGGIFTRQIIESNIENLFDKFSNTSKSYKFENAKYAMINLLSEIISNSPLVAFNKVIEKNTFELFLKVISENFKDNKEEIRKSIGRLIESFQKMIANRDTESKKYYNKQILNKLILYYTNNCKENNDIPNSGPIVNGLILVIKHIDKKFLSEPENYKIIFELLFKCKNSKSIEVKISFIGFLPDLLEFMKDNNLKLLYSKNVLDYIKSILNIKDKSEIKNILLISIGKLFNNLPSEILELYLDDILNYIKILLDKEIYDKEIFQCLSDLLSNHNGIFREKVIKIFDIFNLFKKIFSTGFSDSLINFIVSALKTYHSESKEHIFIIYIILNVINYILNEQDFNFKYSENYLNNNVNLPNDKEKRLAITKKYLKNFLNILDNSNNNNENNNLNKKVKIKINAISLLSKIENQQFLKDIFIFYNELLMNILNDKSIELKKKILEISNSNFIKIYPEDKNNSYFILNNIVDSLINLIINDNVQEIKIETINALRKNKLFIEIIFQNRIYFFNKIRSILSLNDNVLNSNVILLIGDLLNYSNDKNYYITYIRKIIINILLTIENSNDIILKEDQILFLFYFINISKNYLDNEIIEKIFNSLLNELIQNLDNPIINTLSLKILNEIIDKCENDNYFNQIKNICINNLKEGINRDKMKISLMTLYNVIKEKNIDIYQEINIVNILKNILINDINDNYINYILNIFGHCGAMNPTQLEKYNYLLYQNKKINPIINKLTSYNNNSGIDPSTTQAIISLMKILRENNQQEISSQIVSLLGSLIRCLQPNDSDLIDIILPTIIEMIPQFEINYVKSMFENIIIILDIFKEKFKNYLNDIINLILKYISKENYLDIIFKVLSKIFEEFNNFMERYYHLFIPIFIKLIKENSSETSNIVYCFTIMGKNNYISNYLYNILYEILELYTNSKNEKIIRNILSFINKIIYIENSETYYPIIIQTMLNKIKLNLTNNDILKKSLEIFMKMNKRHRNQFVIYLPSIINCFKNVNGYYQNFFLIFNNNFIENYKINKKNYFDLYSLQQCEFNCNLGLNNKCYFIDPIEKEQSNSNLSRESNSALGMIKNRKAQADKELIINAFNSKNCKVEDDWNEWFKNISKILFEQSPSFALYYCSIVADYHFPLIIELYNYGFISVWTNLNDYHKMTVIQNLNDALDHPKTPNDILLTILNLSEFIERENENIGFIDFFKLGKVAFKCKAYAKALYYKENDFMLKNDKENFEQLIRIYYNVKLPESAFGLIKLAKKNFKENNLYNNEYKWYIKLHQYNEGLRLIDEKIKNLKEKEEEIKPEIIKDRIICLDGLCDWEELLNSYSEQNNNDLEIEYILSKASLNLGNWEKLKIYNDNINKYIEKNENNILMNNDENLDDMMFDINLNNIIVNVNLKKYDEAKNYIIINKNNIINKIKSLLKESYARSFDLLVKNEVLYQLEEIIEYKNIILKDNEKNLYKNKMIKQWDKRLEIIGKDPIIIEKMLSVRSLVLTMNEDYMKYLKLSKIYRKLNQYDECMKIIKRIKNKLDLNNLDKKDDILIKLDLNLNRCIFESGDVEKARENSNNLINKVKNSNSISDKIKSKVYCANAIYYIKGINFSQQQNNNNLDLNNIIENLSISTSYNNKNYQSWHNFAMINYQYIDYINNNEKITGKYIINAINGFTNSIIIGDKNRSKTFQDLLRLIDLFFKYGSDTNEISSLISNNFNLINTDCYLDVVPQLICRIDIMNKNKIIFKILSELLVKIGKKHPRALIYPLIVMKNSRSHHRKIAAENVLNSIIEINIFYKELINECSTFIDELNRCAMLLHEEWFDTIEESAKLFFTNKDINGMITLLLGLHQKMKKKPETMNEIHFYQLYQSNLREAENLIKNYLDSKNIIELKQAWEIYHSIYRSINENYKSFNTIYLQNVSPILYNLKKSKISIPGIYSQNNEFVGIKSLNPILHIFLTKQHPRKINIYGTDEKEYMFLLKGHEDLRQDERAMQLFKLCNTLLSSDCKTSNKNLYIQCYGVLPLSHNTGLIGWVPNCDTLNQLIKEQRIKTGIIPNVEHRTMYAYFPKFETTTFLSKVEIFKEALRATHGNELNKILWSKSKNCERWLERRSSYSRSLAVMSIVGYILGLGDRHPSNLMMDKESGKIIHIDFGDCFEVAMKRDKFPEKVPFRLTRMLIKALEVSGIEGTFKLTCENVMRICRNNMDSLLAILKSFIHDPLISFRLMIPMIMKKNKMLHNINNSIRKNSNTEENQESKNNKIKEINDNIKNKEDLEGKIIKDLKKNKASFIEDEKEKEEKEENNEINENNNVVYLEVEEKKQRKKMENESRQIFTLFEERDEIESEELNKIAQIVINRIKNKLSGTDFDKNIVYNYKEQVEKLIKQATSHENLAQSYLGWCPFW